MKPLEIFRTGAHAPEVGAKELAAIAASYDTAKHEAPITKGHPANNAPAYGWIDDVFVKGNSLYALPKEVDKNFQEEVGSGAFKKISASFYKPGSPANPTPGQYALRHVGFLGATPPASKGMRPVQFSEGDTDYLTYQFNDNGELNMNDTDNTKFIGQFLASMLAAFGRGQAGKEPVNNDDNPKPAAAHQEAANLTEREAAIAKREAALKAAEAKAARADSESYAEALIKEGKLLPAHKATVISLLESINAKETVAFDEDGSTVTKTKMDAVKTFLDALPKQVEYSETAKPDGDAEKRLTNYIAPQGFEVDQKQLAVHQAALDYQEKGGGSDKVDYITAVQAVSN